MTCAVAELGHILGKKWSIAIVEEIALDRFEGFNEFIRKSRHLTPHILSMELQEMEKAGFVKKGSKNSTTSYKLTQKGKDLHAIIRRMKEWSIKWHRSDELCKSITCTECPDFYRQ